MLANFLLSRDPGMQSVRLTWNVRGTGAPLEQNSMGYSRGGGVVSDAFWEAG